MVLQVLKVVLVQFTLVLKPQGVKVLKDWNFFFSPGSWSIVARIG